MIEFCYKTVERLEAFTGVWLSVKGVKCYFYYTGNDSYYSINISDFIPLDNSFVPYYEEWCTEVVDEFDSQLDFVKWIADDSEDRI